MTSRIYFHCGYRAVHVPTKENEPVREYIHTRGFYKEQLKKTKQDITSFYLQYRQHH